MKALTIQQPWASSVITGIKTIENRTWPTCYTGLLVIHAGLKTAYVPPEIIREHLQPLLPLDMLPYGALLGTVRLVDCREMDGQFRMYCWAAEGPWCWLLTNPKPFPKPIPYRGKQGLWDVPDEIVKEARG